MTGETEYTNDGGPAFPTVQTPHNPGMSLRDYFAAQAMQANLIAYMMKTLELAKHVGADQDLPDDAQIARESYESADAMLVEREKST